MSSAIVGGNRHTHATKGVANASRQRDVSFGVSPTGDFTIPIRYRFVIH
jgi:hypothetical protein